MTTPRSLLFLATLLTACGEPAGSVEQAKVDELSAASPMVELSTAQAPRRTRPARGMEAGTAQVRLPSASAGDEGLAVQVWWPATHDARHEQGAPVVIHLQGGWDSSIDPSGSDADQGGQDHGFVVVKLALPGGSIGRSGPQSGGSEDFRGWDSVEALRDVALWAAGELEDVEGHTLLDLVPHADVDNLGIFAESNGGNLALAALATEAEHMPELSWLLTWESPIGDQFVNGDLDEDSWYTPGACSTAPCATDDLVEGLAWDPEATTTVRSDLGAEIVLEGAYFFDTDRDGVADEDEQIFLPAPSATGAVHFSAPLTQAILDQDARLHAEHPAPAWRVDDVDAYWAPRDGARHLADVAAAWPDLLVMQLGTVEDHAQALSDHAHSRSYLQGLLDEGQRWVRMNPDASYLAATSGDDGRDLPDNLANTTPDGSRTEAAMVPERIADGDIQLAGLLELMDRAASGDTEADLDQLLFPITLP